jgi:hypothetical protein
LYYLGEYFHLFFFSMTIATFFFGAWENPTFNFIINEKLIYYNDILFNSYLKKPYSELNYSYPYILKLYDSSIIKLKSFFLINN